MQYDHRIQRMQQQIKDAKQSASGLTPQGSLVSLLLFVLYCLYSHVDAKQSASGLTPQGSLVSSSLFVLSRSRRVVSRHKVHFCYCHCLYTHVVGE